MAKVHRWDRTHSVTHYLAHSREYAGWSAVICGLMCQRIHLHHQATLFLHHSGDKEVLP